MSPQRLDPSRPPDVRPPDVRIVALAAGNSPSANTASVTLAGASGTSSTFSGISHQALKTKFAFKGNKEAALGSDIPANTTIKIGQHASDRNTFAPAREQISTVHTAGNGTGFATSVTADARRKDLPKNVTDIMDKELLRPKGTNGRGGVKYSLGATTQAWGGRFDELQGTRTYAAYQPSSGKIVQVFAMMREL